MGHFFTFLTLSLHCRQRSLICKLTIIDLATNALVLSLVGENGEYCLLANGVHGVNSSYCTIANFIYISGHIIMEYKSIVSTFISKHMNYNFVMLYCRPMTLCLLLSSATHLRVCVIVKVITR